MPSYQYGERVDGIDRNGASVGLDSFPQLSFRICPTSSVAKSTRTPCPPTDFHRHSALRTSGVQSPPIDLLSQDLSSSSKIQYPPTELQEQTSSTSTLQCSPNYLHGPRTLLNIRPLSRAKPLSAYTTSEDNRSLQCATPVQAHTDLSTDWPSNHRPFTLKPSRPRRDSAIRSSWIIKKTTEVRVSHEYVKSSGSNVFVERGDFDDGEMFVGAGSGRAKCKYSVKVWADGRDTEVTERRRNLDEAVDFLFDKGKRAWKKVKAKAMGKGRGNGKKEKRSEVGMRAEEERLDKCE